MIAVVDVLIVSSIFKLYCVLSKLIEVDKKLEVNNSNDGEVT